MAVVNKWENACRLCSEEKNEMLPIFGNEGVQRKVAQKLRACLPVLVYKTDPLPKQICQFCAARLDDAYEFREYCLNVYKSMHLKLLAHKNLESVQIFFDAMSNSPDPCQAQLCKEKPRAPPPLVPLPATIPLESHGIPTEMSSDNLQNNNMDTLSELPCEVEIKEMNSTPILEDEVAMQQLRNAKNSLRDNLREENRSNEDSIVALKMLENNNCKPDLETSVGKEEKRTSILEQVLTGSLTINDRKESKPRVKLSSNWWCAPCNTYYKSSESLMKHLQFHCPRTYTCRKCPTSFDSVKDLAKHEATSHLKVTLDFEEVVQECHQCDRTFVCWEMLRQHRLRDHLGEDVEIGINTWCSPCNRFFPSLEAYSNHAQLHVANNYIMPVIPQPVIPVEPQAVKEVKREHFNDNPKSLTCPTCGKVCTQQSALSNHMRTHEPKRHKCDICGRSFGLFIRLAAHRLSEHNQQPSMSPLMATVEQEEALNEEREAREARELRTRGGRTRTYSETIEKDDDPSDDIPAAKRNAPSSLNALKNVARCGICLQWFSDHTTMLTHLQTHSENYTCKTFNCSLCKKSFKEKWQLFRHEMSHKRGNTEAVYTCTVCNQTFTDKSTYKMHQKGHGVDKTYHCSKCNKLFFKEVSLLTHQCTGDPTFVKKTPNAKTSQKSATQDGSKKYTCSKCNASFATFQSRNSHMRVHSDGQAAARKSDSRKDSDNDKMPTLTPETSVELTVPPIEPKVEIKEEAMPIPVKRTLIRTAGGYRCGVCQSPFVLRELAIAHLRSAHPVMPYQCPYCKKRFTTQYTFTHHIKTDHPDEPEK